MTYEEKINWLFRYREAERLYQRLSYRLAEAQEATRHITQNLSAAPGGSKDGQSLARAVEREEEAERRAYAQLAVLDALFAEIDAVLVQLDSAEYCALRKYYLDCLKCTPYLIILHTWELTCNGRRHDCIHRCFTF